MANATDISKLRVNGTDYNVKDAAARSGLGNKQDTLVSGTNIKTLNNESLLGSGNISIEAEAMTPQEVEFILQFGAVDPILANNSWETIRQICEMGKAAEAGWRLGDTKTDVGMDGTTRTFRICDMQGLYGKHVVFEQVELESTSYVWDSGTSGVTHNNYSISEMRTVHLPAILNKYSNELQASITNTTYKVATSGEDGTILDLTDKLFLPAAKEILIGSTFARNEELLALTRFALYEADSTTMPRIKYQNGTATFWWHRSPRTGDYYRACGVNSTGSASSSNDFKAYGVAPCFAF